MTGALPLSCSATTLFLFMHLFITTALQRSVADF